MLLPGWTEGMAILFPWDRSAGQGGSLGTEAGKANQTQVQGHEYPKTAGTQALRQNSPTGSPKTPELHLHKGRGRM